MFDCHAHTALSYCAEPELSPQLYATRYQAQAELSGVAITDHGMAVYFPHDLAWSWAFMADSRIFDQWRDHGNQRFARHLDELAKFAADGIVPGLEVEMMHDGRLTLDPAMRPRLQVLVGSVHHLPEAAGMSPADILAAWQKHTRRLLTCGIDVLGHPFRWLAAHVPVTAALVRDTAAAAGHHGVAIEINAHYHIAADALMLKIAAELGVPVAMATDAHRPDEIGDFSYHRAVLHESAINLADLHLFSPVKG